MKDARFYFMMAALGAGMSVALTLACIFIASHSLESRKVEFSGVRLFASASALLGAGAGYGLARALRRNG